MTSYRPDRDAQRAMWTVSQENSGSRPGYRTMPYIDQRGFPSDTFQTTQFADSGYASPLSESAAKGSYDGYYAPSNQNYSGTTGTYPGARSTVTIARLPGNQSCSWSQEYEDVRPLVYGAGENYSENAYASRTLGSPSSYRSIVVTQVEPRPAQILSPEYPVLRSDGGRPAERHIDVQVYPRGPPLPQGAMSRLVYSSQPTKHGVVHSKPFNPTLPPRPRETYANPPQQGSGGRITNDGMQDHPRPYQLKPTMDPVPNATAYPRPLLSNFESSRDSGKEAEVDALTDLLVQNMQVAGDPDFYGMCARCGRSIMGENSGCSALDQLFHVACFRCISCHVGLRGHPFYAMEGKPYCENCYMETLEKCSMCSKPITDRMLRATGKPYHPACFNCVVCGKNLDGVAFTIDSTGQIHCIEDFHRKFAPRCCVCNEPIMPRPGKEETIRIVALDRSFHIDCYRCEDCGMLLSSESEGRGCYPLDDHILCKSCNARRVQRMTTKMTTEL